MACICAAWNRTVLLPTVPACLTGGCQSMVMPPQEASRMGKAATRRGRRMEWLRRGAVGLCPILLETFQFATDGVTGLAEGREVHLFLKAWILQVRVGNRPV